MRIQRTTRFSLEIAELIQKGELDGEITFERGTAKVCILSVLGTGRLLAQLADAPENNISLEKVKDKLVCRIYMDVPDIPERIADKPGFDYHGKTFVAAGSFRSNGIPDDFLEISKHIGPALEDVPIADTWDHDAFYAAMPEEDRENDIFWCLEAGCYVCPGQRCLFVFNL